MNKIVSLLKQLLNEFAFQAKISTFQAFACFKTNMYVPLVKQISYFVAKNVIYYMQTRAD